MSDFSIRELFCADLLSERGKTTWEWHLPGGQQITVYRRKKGTKFGAHFHKGEDPSKNPEFLLLLSGKMFMETTNAYGEANTEILHASSSPVELVMHPNVLHSFIAVEPVVYIEYRKTRFDKKNPDTFDASLFPSPK